MRFHIADPVSDHPALLDMNLEYLGWVGQEIERTFGLSSLDLLGMPLAEYVPGALAALCTETLPRGVFYLLEVDGELAGMGGIRYIRTEVAELKRIYLRPGFRGQQLGQRLLQRLLEDARHAGYRQICLDTAPFMHAARRLYESNDFQYCDAYPETEAPRSLHANWCFMQRNL